MEKTLRDWPRPVSDAVNDELERYAREKLGGKVASAYRQLFDEMAGEPGRPVQPTGVHATKSARRAQS